MPVASRPAHPRPELPGLPKRHGQCLPPLVPGATPAGCHWHQLAVHPVPEQNVLAFCRAYLILFGSISPSFAFVVLFFRLPYQRLKVRVQEIGGTLCGTSERAWIQREAFVPFAVVDMTHLIVPDLRL